MAGGNRAARSDVQNGPQKRRRKAKDVDYDGTPDPVADLNADSAVDDEVQEHIPGANIRENWAAAARRWSSNFSSFFQHLISIVSTDLHNFKIPLQTEDDACASPYHNSCRRAAHFAHYDGGEDSVEEDNLHTGGNEVSHYAPMQGVRLFRVGI